MPYKKLVTLDLLWISKKIFALVCAINLMATLHRDTFIIRLPDYLCRCYVELIILYQYKNLYDSCNSHYNNIH